MTGRRSVFALAVALGLLAGCGNGPGPGDAGAGQIGSLHRQAVAGGYTTQAEILADGDVSLDEYTNASDALVQCARREGVALEAVRTHDMRGATVVVQPTVVSEGEAGARATRVTEQCQATEQLLVDEAWQSSRPEISDEAYDLWLECLGTANFDGDVPRSYQRILRDLDGELVARCEPQVWAELDRNPPA